MLAPEILNPEQIQNFTQLNQDQINQNQINQNQISQNQISQNQRSQNKLNQNQLNTQSVINIHSDISALPKLEQRTISPTTEATANLLANLSSYHPKKE